MLPGVTLVLGGAASGKSAWAENLLLSSDLGLIYAATARVHDDEMQAKVAIHRSRRGPRWTDVDARQSLSDALQNTTSRSGVLLDCTTMWLTNLLMDGDPIDDAPARFLSTIAACDGRLVIVSNELGQGIVPPDPMSRQFREIHGRLNIAIAERADLVVQVVAGLPNVLKGAVP